MLSSLISLWRIPSEWICYRPRDVYRRRSLASSSDNRPHLFNILNKSPSTYSITKNIYLWFWNTSINYTTFSCFNFSCNSISFWIFYLLLFIFIMLFSIHFIATFAPVNTWIAKCTLPNEPFPNRRTNR